MWLTALKKLHNCRRQRLKLLTAVGQSAENCYALSATAFKHFKLCWQCNKNDIKTIKTISCNKMQHEVAACSSRLQPDMLQLDSNML
jgi:hypothetical protein